MKSLKLYFNLLPAFGIILIIITAPLVIIDYPGGSITNIHTHGFEWTGNYWCHLYEETALNGQYNYARTYALISSTMLAIIMIGFFLIISKLNKEYKIQSKVIKYFGVIGMLISLLGMTKYHDLGVVAGGTVCTIAIAAIFSILLKEKKWFLLFLGFIWGILLIINYGMYFSGMGIEHLPLVQKISFSLFSFWMVLLNYITVKEKT